jgi:hypothetical protein
MTRCLVVNDSNFAALNNKVVGLDTPSSRADQIQVVSAPSCESQCLVSGQAKVRRGNTQPIGLLSRHARRRPRGERRLGRG